MKKVQSQSTTPILIGGFYRSGTTLLRRILDSHSNIVCGPQIKFFADFYQTQINDPLAQNRLFKTLKDNELETAELLPIWGEAMLKTLDLIRKKANKKRWADKNPDNTIYLKQWASLLGTEGFKYIHLIRDPVDTISSLKEIGFKKTVPQNLSDQSKLLEQHNLAAIDWKQRYPNSTYILRYEQLVSNPKKTICEVLNFLDEKFEPAMLESIFLSARRRGIEDPKIDMVSAIHTDSIGSGQTRLGSNSVSKIKQVVEPTYKVLCSINELQIN